MFILNLTVSKIHVFFIFYITSIFSLESPSTTNTQSTIQIIEELLRKIPKWLLFAVAILLSIIGIILAIIVIRIIFKRREARSYRLNYHFPDNSSCNTKLGNPLYSTKSHENIIIEASDQSSVADQIYTKTYTHSGSDENFDFSASGSSRSFCNEIKNNKEKTNENFIKENQKNNKNKDLSKKTSLNEESSVIVEGCLKHKNLKDKIEIPAFTALNLAMDYKNQKPNELLIKQSVNFNELETVNLNKKSIRKIETINQNENLIIENIEKIITVNKKLFIQNLIIRIKDIRLNKVVIYISQITYKESKYTIVIPNLNLHESKKDSLGFSAESTNNSETFIKSSLIIKKDNFRYINESNNKGNSIGEHIEIEENRDYNEVDKKTENINEETKNSITDRTTFKKNNEIIEIIPPDQNKETQDIIIDPSDINKETQNINKKKGNKYKRQLSKISSWFSNKFKRTI
ncbi:hypothetical protein CDIK_3917 [Cucumispora dikerogammari]|nr:hypothetical protein CDIK_3917 [Cucumispora dikerogammari]